MRARTKIPADLQGLTRSEWGMICEQGLGKEERDIVRLHILDRLPQIDTAIELDISPSTVSRRLEHIYDRARTVRAKLHI